MKKDLFVYLNETKRINFQVLDENGAPIDFDTTAVLFQTAKEFYTNLIESLTIGDGLTIIDEQNAVIELQLTPTYDCGYRPDQHVYQLIYQDINSGAITVCLSGRLFIDPTIENS